MSSVQQTGGHDGTASSVTGRSDAESTDEPAVAESPTKDELFEVLANRRRRYALHYLASQDDESVSLTDLSGTVASWEYDEDVDALDYRQRKTVRNALHQFHLPKLDDAGLVSYDDRAGEVELVTDDGVDAYHDVLGDEDDEPPWSAYALGGAIGALLAYVLSVAGVTTAFSTGAWAVTFLGVLCAATVLHIAETLDESPVPTGPPPEDRD